MSIKSVVYTLCEMTFGSLRLVWLWIRVLPPLTKQVNLQPGAT